MKKTVIFILLLVLSLPLFSQSEEELNYIEILYVQKHFKKVYKKTTKLIESDKEVNPKVYLIKAASLFQLSYDSRFVYKNPNAKEESITWYAKYKELTNNTEDNKYTCLFTDEKLKKDIIISKIDNKSYKINQGVDTNINAYEDDFKYFSVEDSIISFAHGFIGVPYKYASCDPLKGFDCSGFTSYVFENFSYKLPRRSAEQFDQFSEVELSQAKKGDLVFFKQRGRVGHVGIVISDEGEELTMIHASTSQGVMVTNVISSSYWKPKLMGVRRIFVE